MTIEEALKHLDEIEQIAPDPTVDTGALGLMNRVAQDPDGLRLLVARYSGSPSTNIGGYLAITLAEHSGHLSLKDATLIFQFIAGLKRRDYDGILVSSLTAVQKQIAFGAGIGDVAQHAPTLFNFLQYCLDYSGPQAFTVHYAAIELVNLLCWRHLLPEVCAPEQVQWLIVKFRQLSNTGHELLVDGVKEFEQCLESNQAL
jgi:hypothetical protein